MSSGERPGPGPSRSVVEAAGRSVTVVRGGTGLPVVYLHGLCGDLHSSFDGGEWTPFLAALASRFEVVAPALPGYNGSGLEGLDDVEDYTFHLADLFATLGLGPVHVVGHSIGGWFAAELALRRPDLVRRLVLIDPLGLRVPGVAVPPFFGAVAPRGFGGFGEARALLFADPDGIPALAALPDDMAEEHQLRWFAGLAGAARLGWPAPHFQSAKLAARLGRVAVPTLVIRGGRDRLVPAATARAWAAGLPGARLREVPDAGHCAPAERPAIADGVAEALSPRDGGAG